MTDWMAELAMIHSMEILAMTLSPRQQGVI